jgi:CspA family cold shock protein
MPTAEARVRTDRASRYLNQLCGHTARISSHGHHHGDGTAMVVPRRAESSGTDGIIEFDGGRCLLRAEDEHLVLLAEADEEQHLRLVQDAVAERLRRIGRRDQLVVTWTVQTEAVTSSGVVRAYAADEGWGVIDGSDVPGGCWVHFSAIAGAEPRQLAQGQRVSFRAEAVEQDGFAYRAVKVWPGDTEPDDRRHEDTDSDAYRSTLTLTFDE